MKEHILPKGANRGKKRLGRGEGNGHGKTSCRGHKGAGARSGYSLRAGFEGGQMPLYRKLPQRGFNRARFQSTIAIVNVGDLEILPSDKVNLESLSSAGLIRANSKSVKLLGTGDITKSFEVEVNFASASAVKKIEAAGGSVKIS
ncbi:MAG: 50S ribosomal protein L15 [Opitutae bacterium]|nr:50S ribosomal protein L15 [Verrucomicrobiota bacterium]MDA0906142.1 50S ribosomal protein L15 [Verrucomicrobiota bacterium]MDA1077641.1 50S ribosomal protein L15 [Verrucomicrobiota bacterium]NDG99490.1 50S ribosomal protein L15 [Opitutae bacterium]